MKKSVFSYLGLTALMLILLLVACENGVQEPDGDGDDPPPATELVDTGKDAMEDGDWSDAYTAFAEAVDADPTNAEAALFYALFSLADIMADDAMETFADDYLGISTMPGSIEEVVDPDLAQDEWLLQDVYDYDDYDGVEELIGSFPGITMPAAYRDYEEDTVITETEYMLGLANSVLSNNTTGFNDARDELISVLDTRLNEIIDVLEGVSASASVEFTWNLFFGTQTDALDYEWPTNASDELVSIVIGTAEIKLLTAELYTVLTMLYEMQVLDLTFPVQEFWNALNPVNGTIEGGSTGFEDLSSPFLDGFLSAVSEPELTTHLAAAKGAATSALSLIREAAASIASDRDGYTLSSSSEIADISNTIDGEWPTIRAGAAFQALATAELLESLDDETVYLPLDGWNYDGPLEFFEAYDTTAEWPTSIAADPVDSPPEVISVNLSAAFDSAIIAVDELVDMNETTGDPNLFAFTASIDAATGELTSATNGSPVAVTSMIEAAARDDGSIYAIKLPDVTLGGSIPGAIDAADNLRELFTSSMFPGLASADDLVVVNGDALELYLPVIPPIMAYSAFVDASSGPVDVTIDETDYSYWMDGTGSQTFSLYGSLINTLPDAGQFDVWYDAMGDDTELEIDTESATLTFASNEGSGWRAYTYLVMDGVSAELTQNLYSYQVTVSAPTFPGNAATGGSLYVNLYETTVADWVDDENYVNQRSVYVDPNETSPNSSSYFTTGTAGNVLIVIVENDYYDTNDDPVDVEVTVTVTSSAPAM